MKSMNVLWVKFKYQMLDIVEKMLTVHVFSLRPMDPVTGESVVKELSQTRT